MSYNGLEIDMLNLGDADSILVTRWSNDLPTRVLIDGGNASDSAKVLNFLRHRGIKYIDHIVCSHPHEDHAKGLIGITQSTNLDFGQAWMHFPWNHVDLAALGSSLSISSATRVTKIIRGSFETQKELYSTIYKRNKVISEPFAGQVIGFLTVCGPSVQYYKQILKEFTELEKLNQMENALVQIEWRHLWGNVFAGTQFEQPASDETSELGGEPTEPENNSSTILGTIYEGNRFLFTADAGIEALAQAANAYEIENLRWMQIPHHGSRRNISKALIQHFRPKTAFVSADGNKKHPRRAVVNAFKDEGCSVFSTHYPKPQNIWFYVGNVPVRSDYSILTPLYDAVS